MLRMMHWLSILSSREEIRQNANVAARRRGSNVRPRRSRLHWQRLSARQGPTLSSDSGPLHRKWLRSLLRLQLLLAGNRSQKQLQLASRTSQQATPTALMPASLRIPLVRLRRAIFRQDFRQNRTEVSLTLLASVRRLVSLQHQRQSFGLMASLPTLYQPLVSIMTRR
jgi:hypothetical protein